MRAAAPDTGTGTGGAAPGGASPGQHREVPRPIPAPRYGGPGARGSATVSGQQWARPCPGSTQRGPAGTGTGGSGPVMVAAPGDRGGDAPGGGHGPGRSPAPPCSPPRGPWGGVRGPPEPTRCDRELQPSPGPPGTSPRVPTAAPGPFPWVRGDTGGTRPQHRGWHRAAGTGGPVSAAAGGVAQGDGARAAAAGRQPQCARCHGHPAAGVPGGRSQRQPQGWRHRSVPEPAPSPAPVCHSTRRDAFPK